MLKVENMARETAKAGTILPHQLKAYQYLDSLLTDDERTKLASIWRQPTAQPPGGGVFLVFIPTERWDATAKGRLRQWELQLVNGGKTVDQVICYSGAPGAQEFIDPKRDYAGSMRPINPGRYTIGPVEVAASGDWGEGLGRIWIALTHVSPVNNRSGFGIHLDANRSYSPGSAGCIVTRNEQDLQRIVGWLKQKARPQFLEVVYSVGRGAQTLPKPGVDLIKQFEGCHLKAYPDPLTGGDPWTIGWGTTRLPDGSKVRPGMEITQAKADEWLEADLLRYHATLAKTIPGWETLSENRRGALLSFGYNLGAHFYGAKGFSSITRVLKNREYDKVPAVLELYRNPGSRAESGLLRRRRAEGELWKRG